MDVFAACDPNIETIESVLTETICPQAVPTQLACPVSLSKDEKDKKTDGSMACSRVCRCAAGLCEIYNLIPQDLCWVPA